MNIKCNEDWFVESETNEPAHLVASTRDDQVLFKCGRSDLIHFLRPAEFNPWDDWGDYVCRDCATEEINGV